MYRIVLDTNVLISAAIHPTTSVPAKVVEAWFEERYQLVVSPSVLDEYRRAFSYERIQKVIQWNAHQLQTTLALITHAAEIKTSGDLIVDISRDPKDNIFLTAAIEGAADYVVSGDKDLLEIPEQETVKVIPPASFLDLLQS